MAAASPSNHKFLKPLSTNSPGKPHSSSESDQVYQDVEIPQFEVGNHVLWTPGGEALPESKESPNFGVGIIHRIVHYVSPKSNRGYFLAFIYFYEWVPDAIEVTWPDGDRYYRLLVQISDIRHLNESQQAQGQPQLLHKKSVSKNNGSYTNTQIVIRPCLLPQKFKVFHPLIPDNSIIFNLHNQRFIKGIVSQFITIPNGMLFIETDFEVEIYQNELVHSPLCDPHSTNCDHQIAINVANLSQHFWNSEFKLMINNKRVGFEELFVKCKTPSPLPSYSVKAKPSSVVVPVAIPICQAPASQTSLTEVSHQPTPQFIQNSVVESNPTLPSIAPQAVEADSSKVTSNSVFNGIRSKLPFTKKTKTSPASENQTPKNAIYQYFHNIKSTKTKSTKHLNGTTTHNSTLESVELNTKSKIHYVGEYYNDFSETSPAQVSQSSKFNTLPKSGSNNKPTVLKKTSFRSNKANAAPQPPKASPIIHTTVPTTSLMVKPSPLIKNVRQTLPTPPPPPPPPPPSPIPPLMMEDDTNTDDRKASKSLQSTSVPERSELLHQIRLGKSLRHVESNDRSNGISRNVGFGGTKSEKNLNGGDFASIIMGALANRRAMIDSENSSSDEEGGRYNGQINRTISTDDDTWD